MLWKLYSSCSFLFAFSVEGEESSDGLCINRWYIGYTVIAIIRRSRYILKVVSVEQLLIY